MRSRTSSSCSGQVLPSESLPPSSLDISNGLEGGDIKSPLIEKKSPSVNLTWPADIADLFILLCSFLLVAISVVFVALVFHAQTTSSSQDFIPDHEALSILQRVISSLSLTITSAVIMVAGKRYVLFKLTRGGLRSRRVAVYSNPSIATLTSYLVLHGAELPLLGLSAVWGLALVTSLTVNSTWELGSVPRWWNIAVPFGPFAPATSNSSWLVSAFEQLHFVTSSVCFGVGGAVGLINITNTIATDNPTGMIYYPPLPQWEQNVGFSFTTTMNGFDVTMEQLPSVPSTAQRLSCASSIVDTPLYLWSDGSDNQTLFLIATSPSDSSSIFRFNATAIIMGGTLSSTGHYTEFALNGTSWPNVMPSNSQWAQDITSLICNATFPPVGACGVSSFSDFASQLNTNFTSFDGDEPYTHWSTVLGMAIGAYSSAMYPYIGDRTLVPITQYDSNFTPQYGIYILIVYIVVSLVLLVVVVRLRLASHLGSDFIDSTRLLLDPLKKPELFNASLNTTVDALEDPYMLIREDSEFLVVERKLTRERRKRTGRLALRYPFDRSLRK